MPRPLKEPRLPTTPGDWLAQFRYRTLGTDGLPLTSEALGALVGTSGATVRRWENNASKPNFDDITAIAFACKLSEHEWSFLQQAFTARQRNDHAPRESAFQGALAILEATENPAVLIDSFMFVRARNAYMEGMQGERSRPGATPNPITFWLRQVQSATDSEDLAEKRSVLKRWLRDLWFLTASQCGTDAYQRFIRTLAKFDCFAEAWMSITSRDDYDEPDLIGAPFVAFHRQQGQFRTVPVRMYLPMLYTLVEFVPVDETAKETVEEIRRTCSPSVATDACTHWSLMPPLADGSFDMGLAPS